MGNTQMILTPHPKLVMHYAPDVLVLLHWEDCPGHQNWNGVSHSACCDKQHRIHRITAIHVLQHDEQEWMLERSRIHAPVSH